MKKTVCELFAGGGGFRCGLNSIKTIEDAKRPEKWWDEHKRKAVEEKTRESVLGKLTELKKETAKQPRKPIISKKNRGSELE